MNNNPMFSLGTTHPINKPENWLKYFPWPHPEGNKYDRGHAIIMGGEWHSTGAGKLSAYAALRVGAGLVSIACNERSLQLYAVSLQAVMTKLMETSDDFADIVNDPRVKSILLGPGAGVNVHTKNCVLQALITSKPVVLDADALSVFSEIPEQLFSAINSPCILTPHEGEFARLFGRLINKGQQSIDRALQAAKASNSVVVLKGANTVIASHDGRYAVNNNATPFLATAGSGDVLAGMCTGLLAQSMPAFEAACAAVWLHAEAARSFGAGLIAEDISSQLPAILQKLILSR